MRTGSLATAAAVVAAVACLAAAPAEARGRAAFMKGKVGRIGIKTLRQGTAGAIITGGQGFTLNGPGRKGIKVVYLLSLACNAPGGIVAGNTYSCGGAFGWTEVRTQRIKGWGTDDQAKVTVTSFDGAYMKGTVSGTFEQPGDTNPTDPPAPLNLKFAMPMLQ